MGSAACSSESKYGPRMKGGGGEESLWKKKGSRTQVRKSSIFLGNVTFEETKLATGDDAETSSERRRNALLKSSVCLYQKKDDYVLVLEVNGDNCLVLRSDHSNRKDAILVPIDSLTLVKQGFLKSTMED
uniref:Uncharacterized protein n=1 Tax=Lotharella oceanica TaxID=641309 RepID=A0A7S2U2T3_9EUKA|mmetsp:Transcript_7802/g.15256  ORF Transcript_7802/g.15256 Transcript_7802/m.15256 type:complete len:130 (+) Transcript_7802:114-503(+)|eukprot:CAMPEP_0170166928 /NCGR_PEP_ID=MMETSP0040_2-20121228/465_1 /TAXON_ID=641309 /ORGANISM="Lotharella oceanica, Strain CCMP622" /LENGTH=129 /DNA_ID=CAMNT_0010404785 /DNA_START=100 /DNA_END=489 /DNA_ORIENTATION=+